MIGLAEGAPLDMATITSAARAEMNAIIDCTGGWWSEQRWAGGSLFELLRSRGLGPAART